MILFLQRHLCSFLTDHALRPPQCRQWPSSSWLPSSPPFNPLVPFTFPEGLLGEETLRNPSPSGFHKVHMQTLDTTTIAFYQWACTSPHGGPSPHWTRQAQPPEPLVSGLPAESQTQSPNSHSSRGHMSCFPHSTHGGSVIWFEMRGVHLQTFQQLVGVGYRERTRHYQFSAEKSHFQIFCQPQVLLIWAVTG